MLHDLTNTSNEEHPSGAAAFIIAFPFGVRCLVSLNSGSADFIAGSDLLIFHENYLYF